MLSTPLPRRLCLALFTLALVPAASARTATSLPSASPPASGQTTELEGVTAQAGALQDNGFATQHPATALKSTLALDATPQAVSILTRDLLDSQQAQNLNDALGNVAGVVADTFGRRSRDDFVIRGQRASESLYLDGLLVSTNNTGTGLGQELFGAQRVEVLKGPASILFGRVQPGGLVNMVSKRPQPQTFVNLAGTFGSNDLRQATIDANTPLSADGHVALRLTGLAGNSGDVPDFVYYKNRYIAPALSFDVGSRTSATVLTSYTRRQYLRQQGLPPQGSVQPNRNGSLPFDRFTGDPNQEPYLTKQGRIGYVLSHRFNDDWSLQQSARWQSTSLRGDFVSAHGLAADQRTLQRRDSRKRFVSHGIGVNTYVQGHVDTGAVHHLLTIGLDYQNLRERSANRNCSIAPLDLFAPTYGVPVTCPGRPNTDTTSTLRDTGVYLRDQLGIGHWHLSAGLRRDITRSDIHDNRSGLGQSAPADRNTGHAGLLYDLTDHVHPYLSYATSFVPNTGTDVQGHGFAPDTGRQSEFGVKLDLPRQRGHLTIAAYDLYRNNVLAADPDNPDFSIAVGQQHSRGLETELSADFGDGWSIFAGYAYTLSAVTKDDADDVGRPLDNVPRNNVSVWSDYHFHGRLAGWHAGAGIRAQSQRRGFDFDYTLPGYALVDASIGYTAAHWHTAVNLKNAFNRHYFAGGINAFAVGIGNLRTLMWTIGLDE